LDAIKDPRVIPVLAQVLKEDTDPDIRVIAIAVLGRRLQDPEAIPALAQALKDTEGKVRLYALRAFHTIHDPEAIPALKDLLKDADPGVQDAARKVLERMGVLESDRLKPRP